MNIDMFTLTPPGAAENYICHDLMGITCCRATGDRNLIKAKLVKYLSHYKKCFGFDVLKDHLHAFIAGEGKATASNKTLNYSGI